MCPLPERFQLSRKSGSRKPVGAVGVARPSRFGNPFTVADAIEAGYEDPQRACVAHFTAWVEGHEDYQDVYVVNGRRYDRRWIREHLGDLAGRDLGCWCKPGDPCHGDVLLGLAQTIQRPMPKIHNVDAGHDRRLLLDAARAVINHQNGNAKAMQRRIRVGFVKASRLMHLLEETGVIGPRKDNGRHEVLVPRGRLDEALAELDKEPVDASS